MEDKIIINDNSGDHKYFSLLPHYILNHSTANDQALYMQMKRYAGETATGTCWASKKTLKEKLNIGHKALTTSIDYLLKRGWIEFKGKKLVETKGGPQLVDEYSVTDIWKQNILYYENNEGCPQSKALSEVSSRVSQKEAKGGCFQDTNKNHLLNKKEAEKEQLSFLQLFNIKIETTNEKEKEKFISYWTEKNLNGTKERYQMQKTFDIKRRWNGWLAKVQEWGFKKNGVIEKTKEKRSPFYKGAQVWKRVEKIPNTDRVCERCFVKVGGVEKTIRREWIDEWRIQES